MSTMSDINAILAGIKTDLEKIDLTKEKDLTKIEAMGKKPVEEVDKATKRDEFGEAELETTIGMFQQASTVVDTYDKKAEIEEAIKAYKDSAKSKEINDRIKARQTVKDSIKGKYDELSRKKAVIEKYKTKYDPKELARKQERKLENNKELIKKNEAKLTEIEKFKDSVEPELEEINTNVALIKELEELDGMAKEIEEKENVLISWKALRYDEGTIKRFEQEIEASKNTLKTKTSELTGKHKGLTLDPKNLSTSIKTAKDNAETKIKTVKASVISKAKSSKETCIKKDIHDKLKAAKTDKEFVEAIDKVHEEISGENINLSLANDKISKNVETIKLGETVRTTGTSSTTPASVEPTEAEIEARMTELAKTDTYKALIPTGGEKEIKQKVYESLVGGNKSKLLHPIAALKANFSKKAMKEWEDATYKEKMRQQAIDEIKAEKTVEETKKADAVSKADKRSQLYNRLVVKKVMQADSATVEQMDKDADKKPGKVLAGIYTEMEAEEEK